MLNLILYQPEIPPNTGNLIRLCANSGMQLHLIEPLGFQLEEKALRRAGLDYHDMAVVRLYADFDTWIASLEAQQRIFALTTRARLPYTKPRYASNDCLLFGAESSGLPAEVREHPRITSLVRIPMQEGSRSLNLSNAASIVSYEALRQLDFPTLF